MKKQQVFYIHGGESYENHVDFLERLKTRDIRDLPSAPKYVKWTKKLQEDLGDSYEVFMPQMPNGMNAKYEEWKIWFERHFEYLEDGIIFIGCSLGAMFLYKYFIENKSPVEVSALVLMASPVAEMLTEGKDCGDFVFSLEEVSNIAGKAKRTIIMQSKDDFLVPYQHAEVLHAALPGSELVMFDDKNHFLVEELPELVELVKEVASE